MAVIAEKRIGDAVVRIHDDYCQNKTAAEVQRALDRIAKMATESLAKKPDIA